MLFRGGEMERTGCYDAGNEWRIYRLWWSEEGVGGVRDMV